MEPHYSVAFDAARAGYQYYWDPLIGVAFAAAGVGLRLMQRANTRFYQSLHWRPNDERFKRAFPFLFGGFGVTVALLTFISSYPDYVRVTSALKTGHFEVVEGVV